MPKTAGTTALEHREVTADALQRPATSTNKNRKYLSSTKTAARDPQRYGRSIAVTTMEVAAAVAVSATAEVVGLAVAAANAGDSGSQKRQEQRTSGRSITSSTCITLQAASVRAAPLAHETVGISIEARKQLVTCALHRQLITVLKPFHQTRRCTAGKAAGAASHVLAGAAAGSKELSQRGSSSSISSRGSSRERASCLSRNQQHCSGIPWLCKGSTSANASARKASQGIITAAVQGTAITKAADQCRGSCTPQKQCQAAREAARHQSIKGSLQRSRSWQQR